MAFSVVFYTITFTTESNLILKYSFNKFMQSFYPLLSTYIKKVNYKQYFYY